MEEDDGTSDGGSRLAEDSSSRVSAAVAVRDDQRKKMIMSISGDTNRCGGSEDRSSYCQVEECTADIADAKGYHKRHRVCDLHAKAGCVEVSGDQQRFCQQCSRFHILSEFDYAKRSCRKSLAGHNQRRRKGINVESQPADGSSHQGCVKEESL